MYAIRSYYECGRWCYALKASALWVANEIDAEEVWFLRRRWLQALDDRSPCGLNRVAARADAGDHNALLRDLRIVRDHATEVST